MRHWPLLCLALACAPLAAWGVPRADDPDHEVTLVVEGASRIVAMAFIGPDDFLVLEKNTGRVRRCCTGDVLSAPVLDLAVNNAGERGLLGIAVHPDFANNGWVYLYYTMSGTPSESNSDDVEAPNQVDRYTWNGTILTSRLPLLTLPGDDPNHNGGTLAFGPDGKLYGVIGDNNRTGQLQNDPDGDPPDDTSIIFRINEDGTIPSDGPLNTDPDADDPEDKIFAYGIRNSFGLAFDPVTEDLWDTENGPGDFDEINHVPPGFNSGWDVIMGPAPMPMPPLVELANSVYVDPAYSFEDVIAPTAVAFTTTNSSLGADYVEDLFVGDYLNERIYRFELNGARDGLDVGDIVANTPSEANAYVFAEDFDAGVTDLKEGPDGALYVVYSSNSESGVYKIEGSGGPVAHDVAVAALKAPKKVSLPEGAAVTRNVTVTLVNAGTATESFTAQELDDLVTLTGDALTGACPVNAAPMLLPPDAPITLAPRKKLKLAYAVDFDCASPTPGEVEIQWDVAVDLEGDANAANDTCPRAASAADKGCGKPAGSPVRTDVIQK